ncbi:hypothetical protein ABW22_09170 [Thiobacillus denitrificans]|uniref:Uncharacterized protein n=1 Tax=Thiobacillus denitrificans TaxID=36861 RepID=A0A119CW01_THIDE|nr:hypothetical protein ABW22_09170 [Thiobacillus denitrificans]
MEVWAGGCSPRADYFMGRRGVDWLVALMAPTTGAKYSRGPSLMAASTSSRNAVIAGLQGLRMWLVWIVVQLQTNAPARPLTA